jgi:rSAM/selenodomain-associated transferase 1
MYKINQNVNYGILFFVKYPEIGKVKSRLSVELDKKKVIILYKIFVEDLLKMINNLGYQVFICYHPNNEINNFINWLGERYKYLPQDGNNLGERLKNCFIKAFNSGFDKIIAIGSDSPDLPKNIIRNSFKYLDDYDAIIGPCIDGGYYLIGFSKTSFYPSVFNDIPWSTSDVYKRSINILKKRNLRIKSLPIWYDIDTINDLLMLYKRNQKTIFNKSKTMIYLSNLFNNKNFIKNGDKKID